MGGAQKPTIPGEEGQLANTKGNLPGSKTQTKYWQYLDGQWKELTKQQYDAGGISSVVDNKLTIGASTTEKSKTLRYPGDMIDSNSDYVMFEFGKYTPPFSQDAGSGTGLGAYNQSAAKSFEKLLTFGDKKYTAIILPMPQELGNEMRQNWEAKSFSRVGKTAIAALAGNLGVAANAMGDVKGNIDAITSALATAGLNKIPGVGGNVSMNDFAGSTRGVILNPNAETLYGSPELREIGMTFKLVPRDETESKRLFQIYQAFRKASAPTYGAEGKTEKLGGDKAIGGDNFIRVPNLCRFTFMKGGKPHPYLIQYKPCAITRVQVNYTPDGTYATYDDGAPVAIELQLQFQETKLVYSDEIIDKWSDAGSY